MAISGIDHLVIIGNDLDLLTRQYCDLGFTVTPGGKHPWGTHNALVPFADGSYLELIAFWQIDTQSRRYQRLQHGGGLIEFMLTSDAIDTDMAAAIQRGAPYGNPVPGSRMRPDGIEVAWLDGPPNADNPAQLPYMIQDVSARQVRVPDGTARLHENGVTGIIRLVLVVADLAISVQAYQTLLGYAPETSCDVENNRRTAIFHIGQHQLELYQPLEDSAEMMHLRQFGDSPFAVTLQGPSSYKIDPLQSGGARLQIAVVSDTSL